MHTVEPPVRVLPYTTVAVQYFEHAGMSVQILAKLESFDDRLLDPLQYQ